jgi:hypothetical protein
MSYSIKFDQQNCNGQITIKCNHCDKEKIISFPYTPVLKVAIDEAVKTGWMHLKIEGGRFQGDWFDFCSTECYREMVKKCSGRVTRSYIVEDKQLKLMETVCR